MKRLRDAEVLLERGRGHERGAMYLAGYAVECKLKAIAMEVHGCWTLEVLADAWGVDDLVVYTHGLEALAKRLPLWRNLQRSEVWRLFAGRVNAWRVSWRYKPREPRSAEAAEFLAAVKKVVRWLESNQC